MVPGLLKALSNWQWLLWLLFLHLPNLLLCFLHQQNVFLSQSHISLGNIPVQSKCRRLLFLNNLSKNETIVFVWQLKSLDFGKVRVSCVHGVRTSSRAPDLPHPTHLVLSHPFLPPAFHPIPLHPIPPCSISSHPFPSHPIPLHLILSHPIPVTLQRLLPQINRCP